ncbi:MAG: hypothetical protein ETSY1_23500 [Candidatus Entotheonella factor]|uniref:Cytochrome c domain-containing protein n=1 Tax=Entotheonella factor TaxID=1429438 RepID=W4LGU5_ENTF1|nr:MAG: hypothetical protein ETSY1_23500 [Candidatus Entotheonella factor]
MKFFRHMLPGLCLIGVLLIGAGVPAHAQDIAAGEASYQICQTCHGRRGEGIEALDAPDLAGQRDWYLVRQLRNFKDGIRGADRRDRLGEQMAVFALTLPDDEAIRNVAAYIRTLPAAHAAPTLDGDPEQGQILYADCAPCHGDQAEGSLASQAPRLNNRHDWYLLRQMRNFRFGIRGSHPMDIHGAQMMALGSPFAFEAMMRDVIAYIKTLDQ